MKQYLRYFFIVNFIVFIILFSFSIHVFNQNFYSQRFEENGAYDSFGKDEVNKVNSEVFGYFLLKNDLETNFFNTQEKEHLKDVRTLFIIGYILLFISFFTLVIFLYFYRQDVFKLFLISGAVGLFVIAIITFLSLIDFNFLFILFHKTFFKEGTWIFNSGITQMYTYDLFYDLFLRILITSIMLFIALILVFSIKNRLKY